MRLLEKGGLHGLCYLGGGTSMSPYGLGNYAPSHQVGDADLAGTVVLSFTGSRETLVLKPDEARSLAIGLVERAELADGGDWSKATTSGNRVRAALAASHDRLVEALENALNGMDAAHTDVQAEYARFPGPSLEAAAYNLRHAIADTTAALALARGEGTA